MEKPADDAHVVALITKLKVQAGADINAFKDWLIELMMTSGTFSGFWSSEIIPPTHFADEIWTLIQKFRTVEEINAWKQSDALKQLMTVSVGSRGFTAVIIKDEVSTDGASGMVATAIVTHVIPAEVDLFRKWELKIQKAQAKFPGYQGTYWQPPVLEKGTQFTTLLRFDTPGSLQSWMGSDERKHLLAESSKFVASTKFSSLTSSFPGWFPANPQTGEPPPNWKSSMLVLAALYPIIMFCIRFVSPLFASTNFTLFNFLSTVCNMIIVTWVCMPILIKLFSWWLFPDPVVRKQNTVIGIFILLFLYGLEIDMFWKPN
jgi:antibiotic biosynthesis monooxygenase (ABM) superfamily enzyme